MRPHLWVVLAIVLLLDRKIVGQIQVQKQLEAEKDLDMRFLETGSDTVGGTSTTAQHAAFTGSQPRAQEMGQEYKERLLNFLRPQENVRTLDIVTGLSQAPTPTDDCRSDIVCDHSSPFRTADGSCNNLDNPDWGRSFTPLRRFLPPQYDDLMLTPRVKGLSGKPLPSPRLISTTLHTADPGPSTRSTVISHMTMQWAQFLDHDITLTPNQRGENGSVITCCPEDISREAAEAGLRVEDRKKILTFLHPDAYRMPTGYSPTIPAEQINVLTAYVDASQVYGSTQEEQFVLRTFQGGLLNTTQIDSNPEIVLLPENQEQQDCTTFRPPNFCFRAGDERVDEHMGLAAIHTIWVREHNRIARTLLEHNPMWSDERVFQEARRIVGAMIQHITYTEFLPLILNSDFLHRFNLRSVRYDKCGSFYDRTVDASIRNSFSTAAYRFGHSLIRSLFSQRNQTYRNVEFLRLRNSFGNTSILLESDGDAINTLTRGLVADPARNVDRHTTLEVRDFLFVDRDDNSLDLMALNIQRGRDHGLPGYNDWRRWCDLPTADNFTGGPGGLVDHPADARRALKTLYKSPNDIDLWSGGVSETPVEGGLLGPTFSCILAHQFRNLKIGDRFFYETGNNIVKFKRSQLQQIRKSSLARVICDNTNTRRIQPDALRIQGRGNRVVNCSQIRKMDLGPWKERRCFV